MKDWQFFVLLGTIYAAPFLHKRYAQVCSVVFVAIGAAYYYWCNA